MSTRYVYGDLTAEIRAWAREHGGKVDTADLAKALAEKEPERYPNRRGLASAVAKQTGRLYGSLHLGQGLYALRQDKR